MEAFLSVIIHVTKNILAKYKYRYLHGDGVGTGMGDTVMGDGVNVMGTGWEWGGKVWGWDGDGNKLTGMGWDGDKELSPCSFLPCIYRQ